VTPSEHNVRTCCAATRGKISEDAFQRLEEKLDWAELHASLRQELEVLDA
jgi:hypothetical protein